MRRRMTTLFSGTMLVAAALLARPVVNNAQVADRAIAQPAVAFAISQAARDLPPEPTPAAGPAQDRPRVRIIPNREIPRDGVPVDEDLLVQQMMPEPNMPVVGTSFGGLANSDNISAFGFEVNPPDTVGDVGPAHYVQQTNLLVRVFNKAGAPLTTPFKAACAQRVTAVTPSCSTIRSPTGGCSASSGFSTRVLRRTTSALPSRERPIPRERTSSTTSLRRATICLTTHTWAFGRMRTT
jgi:hypothetical protein